MTTNYIGKSLVVNEERLPQTVKRFFENEVFELIGELLQNAQRAGAENIWFEKNEQVITITDDGSGLEENTEAWATLLRIADSFYENQSVEKNQNPMGLGFLSLLAHDDVLNVTISSKSWSVTINTDNLWNKPGYWAEWTSQIKKGIPFVEGFKLEVETKDNFIERMHNSFLKKPSTIWREYGVARGYEGVLNVYFDNDPMDTSLPASRRLDSDLLLFETEYEGNVLKVGLHSKETFKTHKNNVVWYGQIISFLSNFPFGFHYNVRTGSPLTPIAPTRKEIIIDEKALNFKSFITDKIFDYAKTLDINAPENILVILALFKLDEERTIKELNACILSKICNLDLEEMEDSADLLGTKDHYGPKLTAMTIDLLKESIENKDIVILNRESVMVDESGNDEKVFKEYEYGLTTFEPAYQRAVGNENSEFHLMLHGDAGQIEKQLVVWRPDYSSVEHHVFVKPGQFALVPGSAVPNYTGEIVEQGDKQFWCKKGTMPEDGQFDLNSAEWFDISVPVWAYEFPNNWDIRDVSELTVGIPNGKEGYLDWIKSYGWSCFDPQNDHESYDTMNDSFGKSIAEFTISVLGDTVNRDFTFNEICHAVLAKSPEKEVNFADIVKNLACIKPVYDVQKKRVEQVIVQMITGESYEFSLF